MGVFRKRGIAPWISGVLREHRWKFLVVGLALMVLGFKLSFTELEVGHGFAADYVRDDDWDVIAARLISLLCVILAAIGFKSKFDRTMFPERFKTRK